LKYRSVLLGFVTAALLVLPLSITVYAQEDYLPYDNADVDEVAQMLDRVEFYASECSRFSCPKMDCWGARKLFLGLYNLREFTQLYAFWISRMPQFKTDQFVRVRYQKTADLFGRLNTLLNQSGNPTGGKGSFSNCVLKLRSACGDLTEPPQPNPYLSYYLERLVTFPTGAEPSRGTAKYPDIWPSGLNASLPVILQSRVFLAAFPVPERQESWIETSRLSYRQSEKVELRYSIASCRTSGLRLDLVGVGRDPVFSGDAEDNKETWLSKLVGSDAITITAPRRTGDYELRIYDPDAREIVATTSLSINDPGLSFDLTGTWKTDDGFELTVNRDGDRLVADIKALGRINEVWRYRKFNLGALFWRASSEGLTDDGRAIYEVYCPRDLPPDVDSHWTFFTLTMESTDSFTIPWSTCRVSPDQSGGLVRLWRVRPKNADKLTPNSTQDRTDN
jgi:hypothetical protein